MKKLALALVCLISVTFLASCDSSKNPEPRISILAEGGCLTGGEVVELNVPYSYGFIVTSSPDTQKDLERLSIVCGNVSLCDTAISGTLFTYRGEIILTNNDIREIVGSAEIIATVTDVAGQTSTASIKVDINAQTTLEVAEFDWFRLGNTQSGLSEFGLFWESNLKVTHAQIMPLENVRLFKFDSADWTEVTTTIQKAELFNKAIEHQNPLEVYNNVSTSASALYDDVIGTITPDGEQHLIHVTRCSIGEYEPAGYPIHITGEAK